MRKRRRAPRGVAASGVRLVGSVVLLTGAIAACCPVVPPPPTAFTARLTPLGAGEARAHLADGRQLTLTGLADLPAGRVYVTGRLLPDGRVAVSSVRPLAGAVDGGP